MDANGLRFWMLADAAHWPEQSHVSWHRGCSALRLASERRLAAPVDASAFAQANSALEVVPRAVDEQGAVARWDGAAGAVVVRSHLPDDPARLPLGEAPGDICVAPDGILYVALPDRVHLHDLRGRWADVSVQLPGFSPWRLAAAARGVWVLERAGRVARLSGVPLPSTTPQRDDYAPAVFRPEPENCHPPLLHLLEQVSWPAGERPVALAVHPASGLAFLSWFGDGEARLRRFDRASGTLGAALRLEDARYAYALSWLDEERVALRMPGRRDAPAYFVAGGNAAALRPLGEVYPLRADAAEAPFAHRLDGPPRYPAGTGEAEPLLPLSIRNLARAGEAASFAATPQGLRAHLLDSGSATTVWHRLYAEASIPRGCGFVVLLAATDTPEPPDAADSDAWHPHGFGRDVAALAPDTMTPHVPRAAWERAASELPGHAGLAAWTPEREWRGLFTVLIQRAHARVRRVVGRYLWVRVALYGDGRAGPEIVALRAYSSRFDYAEHYLPRLYREVVFGAEADGPGARLEAIGLEHASALDLGGEPSGALAAELESVGAARAPYVRPEHPGSRWTVTDRASGTALRLVRGDGGIDVYRPQATQADFLSRFLANFEGVLTPLEDRIAAAHLLTHPAVVPQEHLDWLGAWIGIAFEPGLGAARRRDWLRAAPLLARLHGTQRGLATALDVATGGGVRGGEIVLLEHFRLRRLLATLLGVDLAAEHDPLLPGLRVSGNSIVGDTLILGDTEQAELLALFRSEVASAAENASVQAFLGALANRATVLVHNTTTSRDLGLIRRIAELESPAHVEVRVATATWPLLVGVASLAGVDTYLGPPQRPRPFRADASALGGGDFVLGPVTLDPRISGAAAPPATTELPIANAGADRVVTAGASFELDGSGSRAAAGRSINQYIWRRLPPVS